MTWLTVTDTRAVVWRHLSAFQALVANQEVRIKWGCQMHCSLLTVRFKGRAHVEEGTDTHMSVCAHTLNNKAERGVMFGEVSLR